MTLPVSERGLRDYKRQLELSRKHGFTALQTSSNPVVFVFEDGKPACRLNDASWTPPHCNLSFHWPTIDGNEDQMMTEAKWLLFHIMFHPGTNERSLGTLRSYHYGLRVLVAGCQHQGIPRLGDFFESDRDARQVWFSIKENFAKSLFVQVAPALFSTFNGLGESVVGFHVRKGSTFSEIFREFQLRKDHFQTPVIPWRIYKHLVLSISDQIEESLEDAGDPAWKAMLKFRIDATRDKGVTKNHWQTQKYVSDNFPEFARSVPNMRAFSMRLAAIQQLARIGCLLFTGCRISETGSFPSDCLSPAEHGAFLIEGSPSKLPDTHDSWITNENGAQAVRLAQLVREIAMTGSPELQEQQVPLFPVLVGLPKLITKSREANFSRQARDPKEKALLNLALNRAGVTVPTVSEDDYEFLCELSKDSNINMDAHVLGQEFHLTSTQFRRSLIYYAMRASSIEIGAMRRQFKHKRTLMTEYYSSGVVGGGIQPEESISKLVRNERLSEIDERLQRHLTDYQDLAGGSGTPIRRNLEDTDPEMRQTVIKQTRERLLKRVEQGEIEYRETPLGACLSPNPCFSRLRAELTPCLSCKDAVLENGAIKRVHDSLARQGSSFFAAQAEHFSFYLSGLQTRSETRTDSNE